MPFICCPCRRHRRALPRGSAQEVLDTRPRTPERRGPGNVRILAELQLQRAAMVHGACDTVRHKAVAVAVAAQRAAAIAIDSESR
eukprot:scaffold9889_cov109-Isochrysis_galbana.AAC.3